MERLKGAWPLLAATLLLSAIGATIVADQAHAQICNPVCLPPPDEAPEEKAPPEEGPAPPPRQAGADKMRVLVVNVGWGDRLLQSTTLRYRRACFRSTSTHINGSVNSWFAQSAPPGAFPGWAAEAGGSYTISQPKSRHRPAPEDAQESFSASRPRQAVYAKLEQGGSTMNSYNLSPSSTSRTSAPEGGPPK